VHGKSRTVRCKRMNPNKTSSFDFRSVKVFDPLKVLLIGVPLLTAVIYVSLLIGGWASLALIPVTALFSWLLDHWSRKMPLCLSVKLHGPTVGELYQSEGFVFGEVTMAYSVIGQLRSRLQLRKLRYAPGYQTDRRIPLAGVEAGWVSRWNHGETTLYLEEDEVPGAICAVSKGDNLSIELLVGTTRGKDTHTMGMKLRSDLGSVESWSPELGARALH